MEPPTLALLAGCSASLASVGAQNDSRPCQNGRYGPDKRIFLFAVA